MILWLFCRRQKWNMRKSSCKAHTHRISNSNCFSLVTVVTRTHLNVTLYVNCQSCLIVKFTYI